MGLPTFDFMNVIRGIKSLAVATVTSRVGILVGLATAVGAAVGTISAYFANQIFPVAELVGFDDLLQTINYNDFTYLFAYCFRFDLIDEYLSFIISFMFGLFTFVITTLFSWTVMMYGYKLKEAFRADIKDK